MRHWNGHGQWHRKHAKLIIERRLSKLLPLILSCTQTLASMPRWPAAGSSHMIWMRYGMRPLPHGMLLLELVVVIEVFGAASIHLQRVLGLLCATAGVAARGGEQRSEARVPAGSDDEAGPEGLHGGDATSGDDDGGLEEAASKRASVSMICISNVTRVETYVKIIATCTSVG